MACDFALVPLPVNVLVDAYVCMYVCRESFCLGLLDRDRAEIQVTGAYERMTLWTHGIVLCCVPLAMFDQCMS